MASRCCINCFSYEWLRNYVHKNSQAKGECDYCGRKRAEIIPVSNLYHLFENLMNLYVPSDDLYGDGLIDLIQGDYEVFDDNLYTTGDASRLLEDIMLTGWDDDDGESPVDPHELYRRKSDTTMATAFEEFCDKGKEEPHPRANPTRTFRRGFGSYGD